MTEQELLRFLDEQHIPYQRFAHPAVYTVEQADCFTADAPGAGTKNLFLCDEKKNNYILVMVAKHKRVDISVLSKRLGLRKLRFADEDSLKKFLGVDAGAVTALGVINDTTHAVSLYIDHDLWQEKSLQCHPLVNTATLVIPIDGLEKFFRLSGHPVHLVDVPVRD